jgi:hypothetical protein
MIQGIITRTESVRQSIFIAKTKPNSKRRYQYFKARALSFVGTYKAIHAWGQHFETRLSKYRESTDF